MTKEPETTEAATAPGQESPEPAPEPSATVEPGAATAAEPPGEAEAAAADAGALTRELDQARADLAAERENVLRARAEVENMRRRVEREVENARRFGLETFIGELLPVRDSMALGLSAAEEGDPDLQGLLEGVALTLKLFDQATAKFGLREVDPAGERFDPEYHQAMSMQDSPEAESGTVLTVVQKGYVLNDRLVRPAMVIVAR